jgi:hypothetical protein
VATKYKHLRKIIYDAGVDQKSRNITLYNHKDCWDLYGFKF